MSGGEINAGDLMSFLVASQTIERYNIVNILVFLLKIKSGKINLHSITVYFWFLNFGNLV